MQRNMILRHRATMAIRQLLRRAGLPRDRDADADEVDAGRGARLPRAEPRPPGRVLRAAAVAADLQADPDDRRAWTATSRSSSASATRICAPIASRSSRRSTSRSRSRPRTSCSRSLEPLMGRLMALIGRDGAAAVPAACPTPRRSRSTDPTSRICAAAWRSQICLTPFADVAASPCSATRSRPAARCAGSSCRARRSYSRKELDELVEQAKQLGAAGLVWARARRRRRAELGAEGGGRGRRSAARSSWPAPALPISLLMAAGPHDATSQGARAAAAATSRSSENLLDPEPVRVPLGRRLPDVRVVRGRAALGVHAPSVHGAAREPTRHCSRPIRAASARAPTTSCSTAARSAAAASGSTTRRCSGSSSSCSACADEEAQAALRVLRRRAGVRHAAARRHRARPRPHRRDPVRGAVDS